MRSIGLLGVLAVTSTATGGSPMAGGSLTAGAAQDPPDIVAVELTDSTAEIWLATSAGLLRASVDDLQETDSFKPADAVWSAEPIAGRVDRSIDDFESLVWPQGETLMVASEGVLWARQSDGTWEELGCDGDRCPTAITGLSSTYDDDASQEHDLVAYGPDGLWVRARDRSVAEDQATPPTSDGWSWIELDTAIDVVAAAQDQRGRIWAMRRIDTEHSELRVYDNSGVQPDQSRGTVVTRPLPTGWVVTTGDSLMTPDSRGGMWLGLPRGVLWMNVDLAVHDELDQCDLGVVTAIDGRCEPVDDRFSVMSVDNGRDDIWVGSSHGLIRLSVGETGALGVSKPHASDAVVSLARNAAGGDVWVASADQLNRIEVDRWSWEPSLPNAVTAISAGGEPGAEVVLIGTTRGLAVARWDAATAELVLGRTPGGLDGLVTSISQVLDDGSAFVVTEIGVLLLDAAGNAIQLPDMSEQRVAVVEVVGDRVYAGTAVGVFSAPVERATDIGSFTPLELSTITTDVTAIWESGGRVWVGTGGGGLLVVGDQVGMCGVVPPPDAVVRSGVATGGDSFVLVTSDGVYDARPSEVCDMSFERRGTADTNVAIPAGDYVQTVANQAQDRSRLVWAGADHGIDLIAWTGSLTGIPVPVVSPFDRLAFLDASRVSALATVGVGLEQTLVIGTDYGVYYHRPALVPLDFALSSIAPYDATGALTGAVVDCVVTDCRETVEFSHETRELVVDMKVDDLGDGDRFQFIVDDGDGTPIIAGHELDLTTGRGQNESLTITAFDPHLNASEPHDVELAVRSRTFGQWFVETNAKWVAALVGVALLAGVSGFWVVRALRRRGRHDLVDVEVMVDCDDDGRTTVTTTTAGADPDSSVRVIDAARPMEGWERLRSTKDAQLVPAIGDALYDGLLSHNAGRVLESAGLGTHDVRLRLRGLDAQLDALPWEAMCTPSGSLVSRARTSVVRDLRARADGSASQRMPPVDEVDFPVRVLIVVATPNDLLPITGAAEEIRSIEDAAATKYHGRARGSVDVLEHASPASLREHLSRQDGGYDFVHFIVHGERTGRGSRIWLEDDDGDAVRVESDELVDLFAGRERGVRRVRLVVLNTCSSADGEVGADHARRAAPGYETALEEPGPGAAVSTIARPRAVAAAGEAAASLAVDLVRRANVPAVIGMSMKIRTPAAIAFGTTFYRTLFRHGQVDHAMLVGRREIQESDADWLAPRLYIGSPEPELFGGE